MITHSHEKYIRDSINGVLSQNFKYDLKLLISDDFSPDDTALVVNSFKDHLNFNWIQYYKHGANKGMMQNFLWTLDKCESKYIAICEGDDYWTDPYKLQKQVDFLEANPEYVACFHDVETLDKNGRLVNDYVLKVPESHETIYDIAQNGNFIHTPSVVFRNVIETFPQEFYSSPIGDFYLYMLLAAKGKFYYMNESMAVYRCDVGTFSILDAKVKSLKFNQCIFLIWHYYKDINSKVAEILFNRLWIYIKNSNSLNAIDEVLNIYPVKKDKTLAEWLFQLEDVHKAKLVEEGKNQINIFLRHSSIIFLCKVIFYKIRTGVFFGLKNSS